MVSTSKTNQKRQDRFHKSNDAHEMTSLIIYLLSCSLIKGSNSDFNGRCFSCDEVISERLWVCSSSYVCEGTTTMQAGTRKSQREQKKSMRAAANAAHKAAGEKEKSMRAAEKAAQKAAQKEADADKFDKDAKAFKDAKEKEIAKAAQKQIAEVKNKRGAQFGVLCFHGSNEVCCELHAAI
jgi:hypothetical protein